MNWFERYGIVGAYFIGLIAGWAYAFCPNLFTKSDIKEWLPAAAAISFLPIGYIISVIGQTVYLNWRRCLQRWRWLRGWLGFHGAAIDRIPSLHYPQSQVDEEINEANALLLTSRIGDVDTHRYMRDWIARRMDVVAINSSIILATFLAPVGSITLATFLEGSIPRLVWQGSLLFSKIVLFTISILVTVLMVCSIIVVRKQLIKVIGGIYRRYGRFTSDT